MAGFSSAGHRPPCHVREGDAQHGTRHPEGLRQVWLMLEVDAQRAVVARAARQAYRLGSVGINGVLRKHTQRTKHPSHGAVSLQTVAEESRQEDFGALVFAQCHHLVPVARRAPVVLDVVFCRAVATRLHANRLLICPPGHGAEVAHHAQRHLDVWAAHDTAGQTERQSAIHHRTDHQQGADILAAHIALHREGIRRVFSALHARDAQWRETLLTHIFDTGAQPPQSLHQHPDGAVLHPLAARDDACAGGHGQISRHKAHGCASRTDVDGASVGGQRPLHGACVITVREVVHPLSPTTVCHAMSAPAECIDEQSTVADALAGRQMYCLMQNGGRSEVDSHALWNFFSSNLAQSYENIWL